MNGSKFLWPSPCLWLCHLPHAPLPLCVKEWQQKRFWEVMLLKRWQDTQASWLWCERGPEKIWETTKFKFRSLVLCQSEFTPHSFTEAVSLGTNNVSETNFLKTLKYTQSVGLWGTSQKNGEEKKAPHPNLIHSPRVDPCFKTALFTG